jgi:O-antigen ligase
MARRRALSAIIFVVLALVALVGTNPFETYFATINDNGGGDATMQIVILALSGLMVIAQVEYSGTRRPMAIPLTVMIVLAYCLISASWAINPLISVRRLVLTGLVIWLIVRCVGDLGAVRTIRLLRILLVVLMVANYAAVFLTPFGVHGSGFDESDAVAGDWRGVFGHKNTAGTAAALTVLLFLFDRQRIELWVSGAVVLFSLIFLYYSGSRTSMAVLPVAVIAGALMTRYKPHHRGFVWPLLTVAIGAAVVAVFMYSSAIQQLLEDPGALTGRSRIWQLLLIYAQEHPWAGSGFASFWQIGPSSPIYKLTNDWVAKFVPHGHNGYLDLLVTIGIPGLILAVTLLIIWPALKLLFAWQVGKQRRAILIAMLVFCAGHNTMESSLLNRASMVEFFLITTIALMHSLADQSEGHHQALRIRLEEILRRRRWLRAALRLGSTGGVTRTSPRGLSPSDK